MAYESLTPRTGGDYDEGDSFRILIDTTDRFGELPYDITGGRIDFYVKQNQTDTDAEALLHKNSVDDPDDVVITDGPNGDAYVEINQGETSGFLNETIDDPTTERLPERTFYFAVRITDAAGNRVTTIKGEWTITAS